jgi:hypothetical protein
MYRLAERDCARAVAKLSASLYLVDSGAREIASLFPTSRVSIFEVIHMFTNFYKVNLSREEAAALVLHWDCKTGPGNKPQVDYNKVCASPTSLCVCVVCYGGYKQPSCVHIPDPPLPAAHAAVFACRAGPHGRSSCAEG